MTSVEISIFSRKTTVDTCLKQVQIETENVPFLFIICFGEKGRNQTATAGKNLISVSERFVLERQKSLRICPEGNIQINNRSGYFRRHSRRRIYLQHMQRVSLPAWGVS